MRIALLTCLCALLALVAGCFETDLKLGSPDDSVVDQALCGDWEVTNPTQPDEKALMVVRNIGGARYFVGWSKLEPNQDDKPLYMIGHTAKVKEAVFAHVRDMPADGSISKKFIVLRIELVDAELRLRNLNGDFFKNQMPQSDDEFRKLVEANLENPAMYDEAVLVATKRQ